MYAVPELMTTAAADLAGIGSTLSAAHIAAALPTTAVIPAAADEVSAGVAHLFSQYAGSFQTLAGKASVFHDQFVQTLRASAHSYAGTEAAAAASLRSASSMPGILEDLLQLAEPLYQWFLTWPASIQGFVNDITRTLQGAFLLLLFALLPIVLLLLPLLTTLGL